VLALLCYSHLPELWHPTLAPPFHEISRSDVDFSPRIIATCDFTSFNVELLCSYLANPRNRELLYSPIPQHNCFPSPPWHVVRSGGSMSPSVTSLGPTTLTCPVDSLGTWYIFMHPCPFQARNLMVISPPQINDTDPFSISGFRASGVRAPHIPNFHLPKS
jgi:hypothetical protein